MIIISITILILIAFACFLVWLSKDITKTNDEALKKHYEKEDLIGRDYK